MKGRLNVKSAIVDITLNEIKLIRIVFWSTILPERNKRHASKTPMPLGAVGTIKPKVHDREKVTNKKKILWLLFELKVMKQM